MFVGVAKAEECVALFTGAWIETLRIKCRSSICSVALFTGAWIETLKRITWQKLSLVALFTGAWIETIQHKMPLLV